MNSTGKAARRRYGTRHAAKRAKGRRSVRKSFGRLSISTVGKTAAEFVRKNSGFDLTVA